MTTEFTFDAAVIGAGPAGLMAAEMIADAGLTVREALRRKGTPYDALGLEDASLTEDDLLDRMIEHPILINRPFVITPLGTRLCRPSEQVLDLLPDGAVEWV